MKEVEKPRKEKEIQLVNFESLDQSELKIIEELLQKYIKKIGKFLDYSFLRVTLKMHKHAKMFTHELKADLFLSSGKSLSSSFSDKNLYKGIRVLMDKLISEVEHSTKKSKRNHPIKKFSSKPI